MKRFPRHDCQPAVDDYTRKGHRRTDAAPRKHSGMRLIILFLWSCLFVVWCSATWYFSVQDSHQLDIEVFESDDNTSRIHGQISRIEHLSQLFKHAAPISPRSLTVILPIATQTLPHLQITLLHFLEVPGKLAEIILVCPELLLAEARRNLRRLALDFGDDHPILSLYPWTGDAISTAALPAVIPRVKTEWILFSDSNGLISVGQDTRRMLLNPFSVSLPVGPMGTDLSHNASCITPTRIPQAVSYLSPPFTIPSIIFPVNMTATSDTEFWLNLGKHVAGSRPDRIGGIVVGFDDQDTNRCPRSSTHDLHLHHLALDFDVLQKHPTPSVKAQGPLPESTIGGVFGVVLPTMRELHAFSPIACKMKEHGHSMNILLYQGLHSNRRTEEYLVLEHCRLSYNQFSDEVRSFDDWLGALDRLPNVIVALAEQDAVTSTLSLVLQRDPYKEMTLIRIPRSDIPYSIWMGSLHLIEWQNWNVPEITISVITNNRPSSLRRLVHSLSHALYFGDNVNFRINMEQTADVETLRIVQEFEWDNGGIFIHHRVVRGGLLPAVVEAWYPHTDDSYGLLLEDDIEVSPLFYAWVKMAILRYRYGNSSNVSPQLFGISLYQQKNIELRPEGRRPFDAKSLFERHGLDHINTPYLSQIPCSWGAVYFPEHWREFHYYLSLRFSESVINITQNIVPNVRSNKWKKSWKKYFIELVYLRGYVMLYPNYDNFVSLSTNHLEVGSHVKNQPKEEYQRKKEFFQLPLMGLPDSRVPANVGLLDLPSETLPSWDLLPVLNLTGFVSSMERLAKCGVQRRMELFGCDEPASLYDVRDLVCVGE